MKYKIFNNCNKCIGITPCTLNIKGEYICDYCKTIIIHKNTIDSPSEYKLDHQEKPFF